MDLHGSISDNLASVVRSARRLRGHPVNADKLGDWTDLLHHARRVLAEGADEQILALTLELEQAGRARYLTSAFDPNVLVDRNTRAEG